MVGKVEIELLEVLPVSFISGNLGVLFFNLLEPSASVSISVIIQREVAIEETKQLVPLLVTTVVA